MSQRLPSEIFVPPLPSFPVPVPPPAESSTQVAVCFPDTWIPYLRGALQQWIQATTWMGTPEQIAAAQTEAATIIAMMTEGCALDNEAPTPYWDDADGTDADDQAPADEQDWYGVYDGDFTAQLTDWVLAGFIAYSGNIGAAIAFTTIAPKFRLAWKTGNLGGIIRVFIDAADVGTVDTFSASPGVLEKDYIGDPDEEEHSILMVLESVP